MRINPRRAAVAAALAPALVLAVVIAAPWASATHVTPTEQAGNPSCPAGTTELKVEPVDSGTHTSGARSVTLTKTNSSFDWTSNSSVLVVIVKGGPNANVYDYRPGGATSDTGLHAPINESNNKPYGLSHVSFCFGEGPPPTTTTTTDPKPTETTTTTTTTTTEPPKEDFCTGFAYDVRLDAEGVVSGFVGPAIKTDPDVFPDKETLSELALTMPGSDPPPPPIVTAITLEAENSGDPAIGCTTRITYENLNVDLNNLSNTGGLPVVLTARAVETIATSKLNPDGTVATTSEVTILGGSLCIQDQCGALPGDQVPPNSEFINQCFGESGGQLCVVVVLHEQDPIPGGIAANAIRLQAVLETPLPGLNQSVDLKVAHAEADAHPGA